MIPIFKKISEGYRKIFSIGEIEESSPLQMVMWASLFVFYITFYQWIHFDSVSIESAQKGWNLCWPYFRNCGDWYFLSMLPYGYSQNVFYMVLFVVMGLAVIGLLQRRFAAVHFALLLLFIWEVLFIFVLNIGRRGNYDYYQIILTAVLLFVPYKFDFLRIVYCSLYFLASIIKINDGWILGTYFTSLKTGMPLFPAESTPIFTNSVIFMEMVGTWFLLSRNRILQRLALAFFITFHLYSGIIVWYRYPATILPYLLVLFGPLYEPVEIRWSLKAAPGWAMMAALALGQSLAFIIPGDSRYTFEGLNYGFYMFDSNHQCVSARETHYKSGRVQPSVKEMASSRSRCDPYYRLFKIWQLCKKEGDKIDYVRWQFIHSINGGPFYKIVDVHNACELDYKVFQHNDWILSPDAGSEIVGYPVKNMYY